MVPASPMEKVKYRLAIFDFDGTLADSFPFFVKVFNQLAESHGFRTIAPEQIPALRHFSARQMMQHVGMPAWKMPVVAKSFIALMKQGASEIRLFDGVEETLAELVDKGVTLAIVSSNSHDNIGRILGPQTLRHIRHFECGMSIFGKTARIRKVLAQAGAHADEAIYIGDQVTDLEAAHAVSVPFGAVAWGYATLESLRQHGPAQEFHAFRDIAAIA